MLLFTKKRQHYRTAFEAAFFAMCRRRTGSAQPPQVCLATSPSTNWQLENEQEHKPHWI
jgi:hypothetical protein